MNDSTLPTGGTAAPPPRQAQEAGPLGSLDAPGNPAAPVGHAIPAAPVGHGIPAPSPAPGGGIEVRGLTRSFGAVRAVDGMDLEARPGEVTALIGPNGAGKTTLLLVLATLLRPDAGSVRVGGHDPVSEPLAVRRRMGWMPDGFGTWDTLTVREVLVTTAAAYGIDARSAAGRAADLMALLHLDDLADRPARVLSRGQKQRLGLGRCLVHDPEVLLLDEPASGLDPRSRIELRDVLRGLAAQGRTVLVSSHILTELQEMADRAVVVAGGRTVQTLELTAPATSTRWRIGSLEPSSLGEALRRRGVMPDAGAGTPPAACDVRLRDERAAAALLADLVRDGVPVCSLAPLASDDLEAAYLRVTQATGSEARA